LVGAAAGLVAGLLGLGTLGLTTLGAAAQAAEPGAAAPGAAATATTTAPPPSGSPGTTSPAPSPTGELTLTTAKNCDAYSLDATIVNRTSAAVTVVAAVPLSDLDEVPGAVIDTVTVAAGATGLLRVRGTFSDPLRVAYVRPDTGAVIGTFRTDFWFCARQVDFRIRIVSGTTYTSPLMCPGFGRGTFRTRHGTIRPVSPPPSVGEQFSYRPDPGYIGPDQLRYGCVTSAETFGTFFFTVVPAPSRPPAHAAPSPPPQLPATGLAGLRRQVGIGGLLVLGGTMLTRLGRRRQRPAQTAPVPTPPD
jgi:hypothetical protein